MDDTKVELHIDKEFWDDFIQEAFEHIEEIEMNVLILEKNPEHEEIIHTMFRAFHTIKGLSGFVEHTIIQEIAHKTETLMDFCRKGEMKVCKKIVDAILQSSDFIKQLCEDIDSGLDKDCLAKINVHIKVLEDLVEAHGKGVSTTSEVVMPEQKSIVTVKDDFAEIKEEIALNIISTKEEPEIIVAETSAITVDTFEIEEVKTVEPTRFEEIPPVTESLSKEPASANKVKPHVEEYMKVANSKIDQLVEMIGELIINQSLVEQYVATNYAADNQFITNIGGLSRTTRGLQDLSMFLRMVSLRPTFQKITRVARDTIQELGKDVDFITVGDSTEIDRIVTDKLLDPLVHLIKNAISHGVETNPQDRIDNNKPAKAKVELIAYNKRGAIYIEIKDDGRGIDPDVVYKKALEKGLIDPNREYSEEEIKEFILLPGFSTAEVVDNISGRGVGMDVVKTQVLKIGGRVDIKSELHKGSTFTLKIPVNHAIMNGAIIDMSGQHFIVPTLNVKEILQPTESQWIYAQQKRTMLRVRENIVPIIPVSMLFNDMDRQENSSLVMLLESEGELRALPITNVLNRQEVVVKPVCEEFANLKYISGMSILGNGKVSLILDVDFLFAMGG